MRARLDVAKINAAAAELSRLLATKYALLATTSTAKAGLGEAERKRLLAYKALEGDAGTPRGIFFFAEDDLKGLYTIRHDASGKNTFAILRHVGRLKEFKLQGQRCWHLPRE